MLIRTEIFATYQSLEVLRLHSPRYSDHDDGGSGKTAEERVSTPPTASVSIVAIERLLDQATSVHQRTARND